MSDFPNRLKDIFLKAMDMSSAAERAAFLSEACAGDVALRQRIEAMLAAADAPGSFLEKPAAALEPTSDHRPEVLEEHTGGYLPGTRIGPYKLLQQLGEGGMGLVFMAEQEEPIRRKVAIKVIKPGMDSAQVLARFESERQALALMDHPNIARVLDAGTTVGGQPYFVMELVKGIPITAFCDQEHLTPRERLALFIPVCQAVQHAHQKGVIHRDLKPTNVLIALYDGKPVPKVIDFGVAKALSQRLTERTLFTAIGCMVGTLEYMAPEQAELNNLDIDTRADVYALGVLLYELLTGSPPFSAKELRSAAFSEMLRIIREVEPPRPSTRLSGSRELPAIAASRKLEPKSLTKQVQGDLDWIVMKCLEKERGRRYETASAVGLDLNRHLNDQPVQARPPSRWYPARKFARRNRRLLAGLTLFLAVLVAATAVSVWQAVRASAAERQARAAQLRADTERDSMVAAFHFISELVVTPAMRGESSTRQVLDRASNLVAATFDRQPFGEVQVRIHLGAAYEWLGDYEAAEHHYLRSREISLRECGADHINTLNVGTILANCYRLRSRYDLLEPLLTTDLERARRVVGEDHPITLSFRHSLGSLFYHQGRLSEAEAELRTAMAGLERSNSRGEMFEAVNTKDTLASVLADRGRFHEAEVLRRDVLARFRILLHPDREELADVLACLGETLVKQKQFAEAEPFLRESLSISEKLKKQRPDEWTLVPLQSLMGESLAGQRNYIQAEKLLLTAENSLSKVQSGQKNTEHTNKSLRETRERLVRLYEAWGRQEDAAAWRAKLN